MDLDPEGVLGYLLRRAQLKALDVFLEASGGVHPREMAILQLLETYGAVSQQWLADYLLINRSVMVKLMDQLEGAGQVERRRNPDDRRSYALVITPIGRRRLKSLGKAVRACNEEFASLFTPEQFDHLRQYLQRLVLPHFKPTPPAVLNDHCGWLVAHTYFRMSAIGDKMFEPLGLDTRTFVALAILEQRAPCAQQELAGWLSIGGAATVELIDGLEKLGCVRRERSDRDRRSYALQVTPFGLQLLRDARAIVRTAVTEFMSPITPAERIELIGLLAVLTDDKELLPAH
ncbi:MAG TPA: MarR family transcriptional regulator [Acidimicrobiales bacterium]|jgi:DNA-binding MarR family transcriptional regulator|nr:MarR family transcriptional regulator [Acidimicrobiales bacterium]